MRHGDKSIEVGSRIELDAPEALPDIERECFYIDRKRHRPNPQKCVVTARAPGFQTLSEIDRLIEGSAESRGSAETPDRRKRAPEKEPGEIEPGSFIQLRIHAIALRNPSISRSSRFTRDNRFA